MICAIIIGTLQGFSCSPAGNLYTVTYLDTETFDYNIIRFQGSDGKSYILLSEKNSSLEDSIEQVVVDEIKIGGQYNIKIKEIHPPPEIKVLLRGRLSMIDQYYVYNEAYDGSASDGILFWEKGEIKTRVFHSDDIRGKLVIIGRSF